MSLTHAPTIRVRPVPATRTPPRHPEPPPRQVTVLVPAHNEERDIIATLESLLAQTVRPNRIIVVCDNCTDSTPRLAGEFGRTSAVPVEVFHTVGNRARKAGALNAGIRHIMRGRDDLAAATRFLVTMDADTHLDEWFIERALFQMNNDDNLGGLSASCLGKEGIGENFYQRALVLFQRIEYGRFAFSRIRQNIHTMSGAGAFYRATALQSLLDQFDRVFDETSLVEDYVTTLDLKDAGWGVTSNQYCIAYTDLMTSVRSLIGQRERWVFETIEVWRKRGWDKHTWLSIAMTILGVLGIAYMALWSTFSVSSIAQHGAHIETKWAAFIAFWSLYHAYSVKHMGWKIMLLEAALLPELLFGFLRNYWLLKSIVRSYGLSVLRFLRIIKVSQESRVWS